MDNIIFGPIPSRRFGMSLGIDLSPASKQCNFDCLYCELDKAETVSKQTQILEVEDIISQLKTALANHKNIDVITFTANGEPTLYPKLSTLIDEVDKIKGNIKTLILSNGANIYEPEIQQTLSKIDIVKLSLDCVSKKCFKKLDRVDDSIDCSKIVDGMIAFRKIHKKQLITETLFVKTLNDSQEEITKIYEALQLIKPNRVDIGTIDRPPAYDVKPVTYEALLSIADSFKNLPVTIAHRDKNITKEEYNEDEILRLLLRRPLTQDDIENIFTKNSQEILKTLLESKKVYEVINNNVKFYKIS
ncbi:MAG: radical SAM protein [Arcobacteraceae bacterium]|nr:radical SAM protein [Arcobacteraceae bacterium]